MDLHLMGGEHEIQALLRSRWVELGFTDATGEPQALATTADPETGDGLTLGTMVPDRQRLVEVRAGVSEAGLGLSRDH